MAMRGSGVTVGIGVELGNGVAVGIGVRLGGEVGVPLRATAVASFSATNGWPGSGVMTGIGVAVAVGVSAGTGVRLDIATIVAATLATRVASSSGVGVGIVAVHPVSSNIRVVDSTSSFMDISFIELPSKSELLTKSDYLSEYRDRDELWARQYADVGTVRLMLLS